jgi:hypothetical protein
MVTETIARMTVTRTGGNMGSTDITIAGVIVTIELLITSQ